MEINKLTHKVIGLAMEVHRALGPGLLESAYCECMSYETLDKGYRIDLLVENQLVLELKTVEELTDVHQAQLITYLKLGNYPIGLLINFNSKVLKDGVRRYINSSASSYRIDAIN